MLTEREKNILNYMKETIKMKGYPPTVREICASLKIKSTSTVHKDIDNLEKKGYIKKDPSKPRALMIVDHDSFDNTPDYKYKTTEEKIYSGNMGTEEIPILGNIAAGNPILAEQHVEDTMPIPIQFLSSSTNNFLLTVRGESMIEVGIMDGDYILVAQQNTARNGDIVVAMIDNFESEATVKTFYNEGDHIRLQPENSSMEPIIVKDVKILGKVSGVFRSFNN